MGVKGYFQANHCMYCKLYKMQWIKLDISEGGMLMLVSYKTIYRQQFLCSPAYYAETCRQL